MGQNLAKVYIYLLWQAILVILMKFLFIFIISAMILLLGCTAQTPEATSEDKMIQDKTMEQKTDDKMEEKTEQIMEKKDDGVMEDKPVTTEEGMMEKKTEDAMMEKVNYKGTMLAGTTTPYIRYNEEDFNKAQSAGKVIYIYFYASWCPICKSERPTILSAFNGMSNADAVGFEVHFNDDETNDKDRDAARKFGVSYQHTTIILNPSSKVVYRSLSPIKKEDIVSEILKAKNT